MSAPGTLLWFARHEARLAFRETVSMLRGGRRRHGLLVLVGLILFLAALHAVAYEILEPSIARLANPDKGLFVTLTGSALLTFSLLLSQAMETVTRGFYVRGDLDLIIASPASAARLLAVRIVAIAASTSVMAIFIAGPVINVLVLLGGPRYLCAYGVLAALALLAAGLAVFLTAFLFWLAGPKRTRLIAQIAASVIGAGFVIVLQTAAILSNGTMSRFALLQSPDFVAAAPALESPLWWPARAALGDATRLTLVLGIALILFAISVVCNAAAFARHATTVASIAEPAARAGGRHRFRERSRPQALRWKEWTLLRRDPWLVSQSLMQILYLLPAALLMWRNFGAGTGGLVVLVPVLVMAAGQLAGGLAWLALSGEDAPDLIASAPVTGGAILRAKTEAVLGAVALPILPIVVVMAFASPFAAATTFVAAAVASAGACAIQLFFKSPAKRSQFRRRQTSSRLATFAEALWSILIAAAAACAAAGLWLAVAPAVLAFAILGLSHLVTKPARAS